MGLVERPLALALLAGFATGLWDVALPMGIALELLWLDVVAMGAIIQPFGGMAFLLLFPLAAKLSWTLPGVLLLPLVICMMAAHLGAFCEMRYRVHCNRLLDVAARDLGLAVDGPDDGPEVRGAALTGGVACALSAAADTTDSCRTTEPAGTDTQTAACALPAASPEALILKCVAGRALWHGLLYLASWTVLCFAVSTLLELDLYPVLPELEWVLVHILAIIGAVLSLRERRAYVVCAFAISAMAVLLLFGDLMGLG